MPRAPCMVGKSEAHSNPAGPARAAAAVFASRGGILREIAAADGSIKSRHEGTGQQKRHPQELGDPSAFAWENQGYPFRIEGDFRFAEIGD